MGVSPEQAPDKPTYITLSFERGVPVALDGQKMSAKEIILKLNEVGGANGIGLVDLVENRLVGMKSRGVYETPAAPSCTTHTKRWKPSVWIAIRSITSSRLPSSLQSWCTMASGTPLRQALTAFVDTTQQTVTGEVKLKLYKGNIINAGMTSPYSLYSEEIATFGEDNVYDQTDSQGFINLFGLPIKVKALLDEKRKH